MIQFTDCYSCAPNFAALAWELSLPSDKSANKMQYAAVFQWVSYFFDGYENE